MPSSKLYRGSNESTPNPAMPVIPRLDDVEPLTSDTLWSLGTLPSSLVVLRGWSNRL
jgi:hypothetical protein